MVLCTKIENLFFKFSFDYLLLQNTKSLRWSYCSLFVTRLYSLVSRLLFTDIYFYMYCYARVRAFRYNVLIQQVYNEARSKNPHSRNRSRVPALMFHKWSRNYSSYASSRRRAIKSFETQWHSLKSLSIIHEAGKTTLDTNCINY